MTEVFVSPELIILFICFNYVLSNNTATNYSEVHKLACLNLTALHEKAE